MITATYSPEDNKLRLYPEHRLDESEFSMVKDAGYRWAPKQELFVAPMWTPGREDIALQLAGEIGDEDTSLVDRAEIRAERFEEYSDKRSAEGDQQSAAVDEMTQHIPLGQPILVGHHSEKAARKVAEKIEKGMERAVKLWETSSYWKYRAAGAIRSAKYKERPEVRARRIKKIEADQRKQERIKKDAEKRLKWWDEMGLERAQEIANVSCDYNMWSKLDKGEMTNEEARTESLRIIPLTIAHCDRWIQHCDNRLIYEKAMLEEQGGSDLLKPKKRPKKPPILNYKAPEGFLMIRGRWDDEPKKYPQEEMTRAEYKKIHKDYKGTETLDGHRVRVAYRGTVMDRRIVCVFLTDSKVHTVEPIEVKNETQEPESEKISVAQEAAPHVNYEQAAGRADREETPRDKAQAMKDRLKDGVSIAVAPQLYPTPKHIADRMVSFLDVQPGNRVLEPSAGTGMLLGALGGSMFEGLPIDDRPYRERDQLRAVEIDCQLADQLRAEFPLTHVWTGDFLDCTTEDLGTFDRIIMNPPFIKGADIKHIEHAAEFLKPGGRLVALCAGGPRQADKLRPLTYHWEELPEGSFKETGTNVSVCLMVIINQVKI
jgi:phospholipid N-methyltransferase